MQRLRREGVRDGTVWESCRGRVGSIREAPKPLNPTLPETNLETQKRVP